MIDFVNWWYVFSVCVLCLVSFWPMLTRSFKVKFDTVCCFGRHQQVQFLGFLWSIWQHFCPLVPSVYWIGPLTCGAEEIWVSDGQVISATKGIPTRQMESGLSKLPMDRHKSSWFKVVAKVTQTLWLGCRTTQLKACSMARSRLIQASSEDSTKVDEFHLWTGIGPLIRNMSEIL